MITYKNLYGELDLIPITHYQPLSNISLAKMPEIDSVLISLEEAEQVTLITESKDIQVAFPCLTTDRTAYVIHHQSANVACVCKVTIASYHSPSGLSPESQIKALRPDYIMNA